MATTKRCYIAYGSNLNVLHMRRRCPQASIIGTAELTGWELLFRGSRTSAYLTVGECEGGRVPVAIWEVSQADEAALDRYEGFPVLYYKREFKLQCKDIRTGSSRMVTAFAYIMYEHMPIGVPSNYYRRICMDGYDAFNFDKGILCKAYDKCKELAR